MDGIEDAVGFIEKLHSDYANSTAAMEILVLTGREPDWDLSRDEERIVEALKKRPYSVKELAVNLTHGLWALIKTSRLENSAVIQRYGLTPTDLLTAQGKVALWPDSLSKRILKLFQHYMGQ